MDHQHRGTKPGKKCSKTKKCSQKCSQKCSIVLVLIINELNPKKGLLLHFYTFFSKEFLDR